MRVQPRHAPARAAAPRVARPAVAVQLPPTSPRRIAGRTGSNTESISGSRGGSSRSGVSSTLVSGSGSGLLPSLYRVAERSVRGGAASARGADASPASGSLQPPCAAPTAGGPLSQEGHACSPSHEGHAPFAGVMQRWVTWLCRASTIAVVAMVAVQLLAPGAAAAAAAAAPAPAAASANPISTLLSFVLHLDHHMSGLIAQHGNSVYGILFAIVFCETGLVLTPFLPGDSLLFAAGAFAGMGKLSLPVLMAIFITAAILGDMVNYAIGDKFGRIAVDKGIISKDHISKTEKFYAKYGGKTVVLARFVPIVRTFAPFVAGIGSMAYSKFAQYNVFGAVLWSVLFVGGGFLFGNLPFVQKNFTAVVLAIVVVSLVPVVLELLEARREAKAQGGGDSAAA